MHIAFLTPEYPHKETLHTGGIGTSIKNLAEALVEKGVSVSVIVYSQKQDLSIIENGIAIYLVKHREYAFFGWFFYRRYIQKYVNELTLKNKVDLIEAPDWTGITAFMHLKAPLIIRFHGSDAYFCRLEGRKQKLKNYLFEKTAFKKAKAFIAPTRFAGNLTKEIFRLDSRKISVLHYGIDLQEFSNNVPAQYSEGLILYVGTIIRKKGVLELPSIMERVIKKYPNAKLVLIGSDSSDIQTQSKSTWHLMQSQMPERVKKHMAYIGKVPYKEVKKHVTDANVCVFPTFAETQGMVTIEAMALHKPVVNSSIGWSQELIVDGESGFLVHPKDHDLFASRIVSLLSDQYLALEIGRQAAERTKELFDIKKIAEQNIDFYKSQL
ncbi:MAG TPA: glycosyltransferase family 4 protein [Flavobacterium sp.]|nr:glycosyltransferase family 4 protein [Flavobacterium sp.]